MTETKVKHICKEDTYCICDGWRLEPDDRCPQHGAGHWPPRCGECGRFMNWPKLLTLELVDCIRDRVEVQGSVTMTNKDLTVELDAQTKLLISEVEKVPIELMQLYVTMRKTKATMKRKGVNGTELVGKMIGLLTATVKHPQVDSSDLGVRSRAFSYVASQKGLL